MSDYGELKKAAEAAEAERVESGHRWPDANESDWLDTSSGPEYEYLCAVSPVAVLGLIAENERLELLVKDFQWGASVEAQAGDEARQELAALREELATAKRNEYNSEVAYKAAIEKQGELREELRDSNQKLDSFYSRSHGIANLSAIEALNDKLTAAEQRNADIEAHLRKVTDFVESLCSSAGDQPSVATGYFRDILDALKPTESGASNKCASDGGTCGLGGHCGECPHIESGASE